MNDKPTTKKNSILNFKKDKPSILPVGDPEAPQPTVKKAGAGRPTKEKAKRSHKVMVAMTAEEGAKSRTQAGDIPEATFVYLFLKKNGYFK